MKPISNLSLRKERYMRDAIPIRLGGLAANLSRVKSFAGNKGNAEAVFQLLEESKYFIEWTGKDLKLTAVADLIELQKQIARWQLKYTTIWADDEGRRSMANESARWSAKIIMNSGLLDK